MLTTTHILLAKLTLESRAFGIAIDVFDKYILYFPGSSSQTKPKYLCDMNLPSTAYITHSSGLTTKLRPIDVLDYFIAIGTIYIGLRDWESALQSLESAITYPAKEGGVSKIMVEAYKKWLLVSLLLDGKPRSLPNTTSIAASKQYHILARPYEAIAQLFETATASRLKAEADAGMRIWANDFNYGLILNVLAAYQRFQIKNLSNVYSSISITEVQNLTTSAETGIKLPSPQATQSLVQDMITAGLLQATLSTSPNAAAVLTFISPVTSELQVHRDLAATTQRIQALTKEIKQTDRILTHEKDYIKYIQKQKKNAKAESSFDGNIPSGGMDWNPDDEDLMDHDI